MVERRKRAQQNMVDEMQHRGLPTCKVSTSSAPSVQDMSRLGRDLSRCVLVDDTPLAFYFQPDHGVPVLQVR